MHRLLTAAFFLSLAGIAAAQTAAAIPPPLPGLLYSYQYWPTQYIQWIDGNDLPYSMVEFDVDASTKQPLYHCVLTGKDGTRTHYSNADDMVAAFKAAGEPSYKTAIAFDGDDTGKPGSTGTVRFTMQNGKPLEWRFVQGSDISAQGGGVTPLPQASLPIFAYREEGAVAGEGTAIRIGDAVSTAEVWKEISKPPYFVAYRGAVTSSAHTLILTRGSETWKITKSPTALATGSTWELDSDNGNRRVLTVEKMDGAHATISVSERSHPLTRTTLTATRTADGWNTDAIRLAPIKDGDRHYLTLSFTGAGTRTLEITAGKKTKVATANYLLTKADAAISFTAPAWIAGKQLTERVSVQDNTVEMEAH